MGFKGKAIIILALLAFLVPEPLSAARKEEQKDSLVRLIKADYMELVQTVRGPARRAEKATFLHNGTTLICDTAYWQVNQNIINAMGHVKVVQNETILSSERMVYYVDDNLIQCRGTLVQLTDKEHNTLRSHNLDYNTKDSVATFSRGGAMRSKDGQVIESMIGSYDARIKVFNFKRDVDMFTDSVFVKTSELDYLSRYDKAVFKQPIDFWKDDNMLSAGNGWYDRAKQLFFFNDHVHVTSRDQEAWCDSLYYYRESGNLHLLGNAQVQDSTRNMAALANSIYYEDTLSRVTLSRDAAVAMETVETRTDSLGRSRERKDTVYFGADVLEYWTVKKNEIPDHEISGAEGRLSTIMSDPVSDYREQAARAAAEAARKAAEKAAEQSGAPQQGGGPSGASAGPAATGVPAAPEEPGDTLQASPDSLGTGVDSLAVEEVLEEPDTSRIGFLKAVGNVKVFRYDLQVDCDSLRYTDLDSIARFYIDPVIWNEGNRQYSADSVSALIVNQKVDRVNLTSNAFIITEEEEGLYDQIRSTEVMAYFDTTSALKRFDALGTADAIFYLKEDEEKGYATVNKVNSKMLSAWFVDGGLDRIFYFDSPKNDVYPLAQFSRSERELKGFRWLPERRPKGKEDITSLSLRPSERSAYARHPKTVFKQTEVFFKGYMDTVYKGLEEAKRRPKRQRSATPPPPPPVQDEFPVEDIQVVDVQQDTVSVGEPVPDAVAPIVESPDSLSGVTLQLDSLMAAADSAAVSDTAIVREPTERELKLMQRQQERQRKEEERLRKEAERQAKIDARNARWDELDARDAEKARVKAEKKKAKQQARQAKRDVREQKRLAREQKRLQKYIDRYEKKYLRKLEKEQLKLKENGSDTEEVPPLREREHPKQRRVPIPTVDGNPAGSAEDVDGGAPLDGSGGEPR